MKVGEVWAVRYPNEITLRTVLIERLTNRTVRVCPFIMETGSKGLSSLWMRPCFENRGETTIQFIEKQGEWK